MTLPVVMTTAAATGIGGTEGKHFVAADSDIALIDRVTQLIAHPRQALTMGRAAREYVVDNLRWQACLALLPGLLNLAKGHQRDAA